MNSAIAIYISAIILAAVCIGLCIYIFCVFPKKYRKLLDENEKLKSGIYKSRIINELQQKLKKEKDRNECLNIIIESYQREKQEGFNNE